MLEIMIPVDIDKAKLVALQSAPFKSAKISSFQFLFSYKRTRGRFQ